MATIPAISTGRPVIDGEQPCDQQQPGIAYVCTRPAGHPGDHIAHDSEDREVSRWSNKRFTVQPAEGGFSVFDTELGREVERCTHEHHAKMRANLLNGFDPNALPHVEAALGRIARARDALHTAEHSLRLAESQLRIAAGKGATSARTIADEISALHPRLYAERPRTLPNQLRELELRTDGLAVFLINKARGTD